MDGEESIWDNWLQQAIMFVALFFDKVPLSLLVQCESAKNIYHVSCLLSLYSPCEFPPRGILLLKTDKGEVIELSCGANGGNIKKEQRLDGKVFYRYRAVVFFEIKEEKLKEIIEGQIVKVRFQTESKPLDKVFKNNEFSYVLYLSWLSIQRRLYPERFKDELREGF